MKRNRTAVVLLLACGFAFIGCARKKPTTPAKMPAPTTDPYAQSALRRKAAELTVMSRELPGDRRQVASALAKAAEALELLGGPNPTGAFRQQLRIVDDARTKLADGSEVSEVPVTDSGLRAIRNALSGVSDRLFPGDEKVGASMDSLNEKVRELDMVRGALHGAVVAQVLQSAASVFEVMAGELDARTTGAADMATQPPTQ